MSFWKKFFCRTPSGGSTSTFTVSSFQAVTRLNERLLATIADAGEKLGGEYIFDKKYLNDLVETVSEDLRGLVQAFQNVTGRRDGRLLKVTEEIERRLRALLAGRPAMAVAAGLIPLERVGIADADICGGKMARLGELTRLPGVRVPAGFVMTTNACWRFMEKAGVPPLCEELRNSGADHERASLQLRARLLEESLPREIKRALRKAARALARNGTGHIAVRSSAVGEDGEISFAGQYRTRLMVEPDDVEEAVREVIASLYEYGVMKYRLHHGLNPYEGQMAVGLMAMVPARASGVLYTLDPTNPASDYMVVSARFGLAEEIVSGQTAGSRFIVEREPPHGLIRYVTQAHERGNPTGEGRGAMEINHESIARLAATALRIERFFKRAQDIEWVEGDDGELYIVQTRPLGLVKDAKAGANAVDTSRYTVLMRDRGEVACQGVGCGQVWNPETSGGSGPPADPVIVTVAASPRLAAWVPQAAAIVTDVGSTTGHLAAVAREFRVPAIVNTAASTRVLRQGMTVTVDANENVVYEGRVPELMRSQLLQTSSFEEKEEFRLLRRLLRLVAPLNLHDPSGPEFSADNCRTVHDVIRYVHEMTVREMVSGPQWRRHKGLTPRELEFGVPLDLVVIDIGGGVREGAGKKIRHEELRCGPLLSLLESLARPGVWVTGPALLDLRGLMASSTRTPALTSPVAVMPERNVALVTSDSLCLNLKLGYHYNLVDCRASENPVENYVYFRFAGGVTELERRCRRARLLAMILEHYDFVVETSSDLVIGRLRNAGRERVNKIMYMLGRLIGYTRQLDIYLQNDRRVEECYRSFLDGRTAADLTANGGNDGKG